MRLRLYSIKDRLLGVYMTPFPARADVEAVRQVQGSMKDPQMQHAGIVTNPGDYDLCYVGSFDDETGEVFPEVHAAGKAPCVVIPVSKIVGGSNGSAVAQA